MGSLQLEAERQDAPGRGMGHRGPLSLCIATLALLVRKTPPRGDMSCGTWKLRNLRHWKPILHNMRRHSRLRRLSACCSADQ
jgi:hypothetical protein